LDRAPGIDRLLRGVSYGHPLHPALVSVPISAWSVALGLSIAQVATGKRGFGRIAGALTAVGIGGGLVAATAGIADWSKTDGAARRVGFVHATLNVGIVGVQALSLVARAGNAPRIALALSATGFTMLGMSAWLGGELAYRFGVGVRVRPEAVP